MDIELNNVRIADDGVEVTLYKKVVLGDKSKTPGAIKWRPLGHYPNLESALRGAGRFELIQQDVSTVEQMQDALSSFGSLVEKSLKGRTDGHTN